jgi:hypothetical protein
MNVLRRVLVCVRLIEDVVCAVDGFHRLGSDTKGKKVSARVSVGGEGSRTAATASELIRPLRIRLDMSSALVVPVQRQAMITLKLSCASLRRVT